MRVIRFDRVNTIAGAGKIREGVAGRVHERGDGLDYGGTYEYRDLAEVKSIAAQLARGGLVFTLNHPATMPARKDAKAIILGEVIGGELRGSHAVAIIRVDDSRSLEAGLSLGYGCELDANNYQRSIVLDHLASVGSPRCGSSCSLKLDSKGTTNMCACNKTDLDLEAAARARSLARLSKRDNTPEGGSFFGVENGSGVASIGNEEEKIASGARDVPPELLARLKANARLVAACIPDPADRAAAIAAHVANGLAKLAGGR